MYDLIPTNQTQPQNPVMFVPPQHPIILPSPPSGQTHHQPSSTHSRQTRSRHCHCSTTTTCSPTHTNSIPHAPGAQNIPRMASQQGRRHDPSIRSHGAATQQVSAGNRGRQARSTACSTAAQGGGCGGCDTEWVACGACQATGVGGGVEVGVSVGMQVFLY